MTASTETPEAGRRRPLLRLCGVLVALLLAEAPAPGRDMAYVAELSALGPHNTRTWGKWENNYHVPAGESVTVAIHRADRIELREHGAVRAETFRVRYGQRAVAGGEGGQMIVPRYLAPPRWFPQDDPNDSVWALRLTCNEPGVHFVRVVPFKEGQELKSIWLTLRVTGQVPPSDCGFGFYVDPARCSYPHNERLYFEHMRVMGCNTLTIDGRAGESDDAQALDIARRIDLAIEVGLLDARFPVVVLPSRDGADRPGQVLLEAKKRGVHGASWPELIRYRMDEPKARPDSAESVRQFSQKFHDLGLRTGTALGAPAAFLCGDALDVWIIHMDTVSDEIRDKCRRDGAEWWTYNGYLHDTNAPLHRYYAGVWTWKVRPRVNLMWAYMHDAASKVLPDGRWQAKSDFDHAIGAPDGPIGSVALEGFRDGAVDYRILRHLEKLVEQSPAHEKAPVVAAWLQQLHDQVRPMFWPLEIQNTGRFKDRGITDTLEPPVDCVEVRKQALTFIELMKIPWIDAQWPDRSTFVNTP